MFTRDMFTIFLLGCILLITNANCSINKVKLLSNDSELVDILKQNKRMGNAILVMFFAPSTWCKHSKRLHPILDIVAELIPQLPVFKIDAYNYDKLNFKYSVFGFPSLFFIQDAEPIGRYQGNQDVEDIYKWLVLVIMGTYNDTNTTPTHLQSNICSVHQSLDIKEDQCPLINGSIHQYISFIPPNILEQDIDTDYYLYFSVVYVTLITLMYMYRFYNKVVGHLSNK